MAVPAALSLTVGVANTAPAAAALPHRTANSTPAPASTSPSTVTHPDTDYMGSTVHAHATNTVAPNALTSGTITPNAQAASPPGTTSDAQGIDVSHYQGTMDWTSVAASGTQFAYMKATEGTGFIDPQFTTNYAGSAAAGLLRGAYHFALPDQSTGTAQATYFLANGGGWVADGHTLPPVLDIESNPYGAECYGLTTAQMLSWLNDFANTVYQQTNRWPVIYTPATWWSDCTGNDTTLATNIPLWIVRDDTTPGTLPGGWTSYTFWQYGSTSSTSATDGDVYNGTLAQLQAFTTGDGNDEITLHYNQLGGPSSYLGNPTGSEFTVGDGWEQDYQYGVIEYFPATGAHAVKGQILNHYQQLGGPTGTLGFPTTDETGTPDGTGRYNHFNGAGGSSIYWTPSTGAHAVQGAIHATWAALGWEAGPMGYPTTDENTTPDGTGRYNHFSKSASIYWTPSTGAHGIQGAIRDKWASLGWETSTLGYPTSDETGTADGVARYNTFAGTGGSAIYWTSSTGAHSIQGSIYAHWLSLGGEAGALGYPTTDETTTPDGTGRYNHFSNDASIYWTPSTGACSVHGAIRDTWASLGWETSALGYPTSDEYAVTGGRRNNFQHGYITWYSATNTTQVTYN